jgi:hypothetical protein
VRGAKDPRAIYDLPMPPFERALRREHASELLATLTPGGSPSRPIGVTSAAVIEPRAATIPCPRCGGFYRIHEHTRPVAGLRQVDVVCRHCSTPRTLWFRIVTREPS